MAYGLLARLATLTDRARASLVESPEPEGPNPGRHESNQVCVACVFARAMVDNAYQKNMKNTRGYFL
ncbi:histidine triad nucleotide-binding protein 3, partial [Corchorus capsularis]